MKIWKAVALSLALLAGPAWGAPAQCPGDCNGDGVVRIDELVRMAKGASSVCLIPERGFCQDDSCFDADLDGDEIVTVNELVQAINLVVQAVTYALNGCPMSPDA